MKIMGVLSDTHGSVDVDVLDFLKGCDQICHCGDIGSIDVIYKLQTIAPVIAVHGNIDDLQIRKLYPEHVIFQFDLFTCAMTHIGGYPGKYYKIAIQLLQTYKPSIFICGHSHILRIEKDENYKCLFVNPGAAGNYGMHLKKTALKIISSNDKLLNIKVWEKTR